MMKNFKLRNTVIFVFCIILCVFAFISPFYIDSFKIASNITIGLTAVQTVATFIMMIMAFVLYDRFGSKKRYFEKCTDEVEKIQYLLEINPIFFHSTENVKINHTYYLRADTNHINDIKSLNLYKEDSKKKILASFDNYIKSTSILLQIGKSKYVPSNIKNKMKFLEFGVFVKIENPLDQKYLRIKFDNSSNEEWALVSPEIIFEDFVQNYYDLIIEVDNWMKKYSKV